MNLFFSCGLEYYTEQSLDNVKEILRLETNDHSFSLHSNVVEYRSKQNESFVLYHLWEGFSFRIPQLAPAFLTAQLTSSPEGTHIKVLIRPNYSLVLSFYLSLLLLLCTIAGLDTFPWSLSFSIGLLLVIPLLLLDIMLYYSNSLKKIVEERFLLLKTPI